VRVLAEADAERTKIQAEAAASYNRVALDRMLIDQLPQIVREAANGLANANVNVLNGADGLGQIAAGLVGQGLTIFDSVKKNISVSDKAARELPGETGRDDGNGSDPSMRGPSGIAGTNPGLCPYAGQRAYAEDLDLCPNVSVSVSTIHSWRRSRRPASTCA
jgi:flotillin